MKARILALVPLALVLAACAPAAEPEVATVQGSVKIEFGIKIYTGSTVESFRKQGESCDGLQIFDNGQPFPDGRYTIKDGDGSVIDTGDWGVLGPVKQGAIAVVANCIYEVSLKVPETVKFVQVQSNTFDETYSIEEFVEGIEVRH